MSEAPEDLQALTALFGRCGMPPEHQPVMSSVAAEDLPQPYRRLLAHENHMTYVLQAIHADGVDLEVLSSGYQQPYYFRTIRLRRARDQKPLQWALMSIDLERCDPLTRTRVLEERTPLGRILIEHGYRTEVVLRSLLRVGINELVSAAFPGPDTTASTHTFGRHAGILLGDEPAIEVIEVMPPAQRQPPPAGPR